MAISTYLSTYQRLFVGRTDDYAMQLSTGRYKRMGRPLTPADLSDHLRGRRTYGSYVMDAQGRCRFAVMDADGEDGLDQLWSIQEHLTMHSIVSYVECSRRGGHLWIFFAAPAPASHVRAWLLPFCPPGLEFFPKQNEGKSGYGSLMRLPLGIHRKSGQRYPFVERGPAGLQTLTTTDEERIAWFASIVRMQVPHPPPPPKQPATPLSLSSSMRALRGISSPIRQWNAAQDPFQVIGRYVKLNSNGVGHCPFGEHHSGGEDHNPSFKVYMPEVPGGYCWYCFTWQKGGSVFDFLRYYYDLDASTLWQLIQDESL